ncbi:MAG: hypothetical protein GX369_02205 [Euryarchaeota archaeon]|nr:hypothetical protein [Euryarchaeota archaeon]
MLLLSYPLNVNVPVFPGTPPLKVKKHQTIEMDGSRSSTVEFNTHTGSHIDLPAHFHKEGEGVSILSALMELSPAKCIDLSAKGDVPLRSSDLPDNIYDAEVLLIRTGYYNVRTRDLKKYQEEHPWIHPEMAGYLASLPKLKAIGMDMISAASPNYPNEGAEAHKILLRPENPVMIMEDLDLSNNELPGKEWILYIVPLFTGGVESTPITVLAAPR